jgi:hypothetical protein
MTPPSGGKTAAHTKAEYLARMAEMPMVARCAFCGWVFEGTVAEGRALHEGHRRMHHPDAKPVRRKRGNLQRFSVSDTSFKDEFTARARVTAASLARLEDNAA